MALVFPRPSPPPYPPHNLATKKGKKMFMRYHSPPSRPIISLEVFSFFLFLLLLWLPSLVPLTLMHVPPPPTLRPFKRNGLLFSLISQPKLTLFNFPPFVWRKNSGRLAGRVAALPCILATRRVRVFPSLCPRSDHTCRRVVGRRRLGAKVGAVSWPALQRKGTSGTFLF